MQRFSHHVALAIASLVLAAVTCGPSWADGVMVPGSRGVVSDLRPKYHGSVEEHSQEAIIVVQPDKNGLTREDLILKVTVEGDLDSFAWVLPFPREPRVGQASIRLFQELFDYVQERQSELARRAAKLSRTSRGGAGGAMGRSPGIARPPKVEVLKHEVVGTYKIATVRENTPGALNDWLDEAGYQRLEHAEDVIEFYRKKGYVFVCIKVSEAALKSGKDVVLRPLHFTFATGGRNGIYFPMKLSSLQERKFDVNLYVFCRDRVDTSSGTYGSKHHGFDERYADEGRSPHDWCRPSQDPFFESVHNRIYTVAAFLARSGRGERFYLTQVTGHELVPSEVRKWKDDLWLFSHNDDPTFVPDDARPGKCAWAGFAP